MTMSAVTACRCARVRCGRRDALWALALAPRRVRRCAVVADRLRNSPTNLPPGGEGEIIVHSPTSGTPRSTEPEPGHHHRHAARGADRDNDRSGRRSDDPCARQWNGLHPRRVQLHLQRPRVPLRTLWITVKVKVKSRGTVTSLHHEGGRAKAAERRAPRATPAGAGQRQTRAVRPAELSARAVQRRRHARHAGGLASLRAHDHARAQPDPDRRRSPSRCPRTALQSAAGLDRDPPLSPSARWRTSARSSSKRISAPASVVGVATVTVNEPAPRNVFTRTVPVFNLVPAQGEPARFGFEVSGRSRS